MSDIVTPIRQKISIIKKQKKLSYDEIADAIGMGRVTVSNYCKGITKMPVEFLLAFSTYFQIPMSYWSEVEGKETQHANSIKESQSDYLTKTSEMKQLELDLEYFRERVIKLEKENELIKNSSSDQNKEAM